MRPRFTRMGPHIGGIVLAPMDKSHPLDLALKAARARCTPAIRLLIKEDAGIYLLFTLSKKKLKQYET